MFNHRKIHVELSTKCTLKCPRCPRVDLKLEHQNLDFKLEKFSTGFTPATLQEIDTLIFCGNSGDPIYNSDFLNIVRYIKTNSQTRIVIITNGSYKKPQWWAELGQLLTVDDQVTFSVDGWDQESNNKYRVNSDFDSIVTGIQTLRSSSDCCIQWSVIYFAFNQNHINNIELLAKNLGCNKIQKVKSSKFYANTVDTLKPIEELIADSAIYENDITWFYQHPNFEPFPQYPSPNVHPWAKCLNFYKEVFVDVNGIVMPCPWFGTGYQPNDFLQKFSSQLNITKRSLFDILDDTTIWDQLFLEPTLSICNLKCKNGKSN